MCNVLVGWIRDGLANGAGRCRVLNVKRFAITGVGGYIAPRHLKAIRDTGNTLVAAVDPYDSVGILDSYFPDVDYFREIERFDRHLDKLKRQGDPIDYLSICAPNYLHDAHIRMALRNGAHAICEKPLVLNPWNVDALEELSREYGRQIYTVLQLRVHPSIVALKERYRDDKLHFVDLTYITSRGPWYHRSWKGNLEQSGGLITNIGIHFFDMLIWLFGDVQEWEVGPVNNSLAQGAINLQRAHVKWFLSIDRHTLPAQAVVKGQSTFRSIRIDGEEIEFSDGFTDLHTKVYQDILSGGGFTPNDARASIELAYSMRGGR